MGQIGRLFTFGCSFTGYIWPTWADILGQEADYFENWGIIGGGNQFIFNSVNECVLRNKLNSDDVVIVMWTNIWRDDRYVQGQWVTPGNIYHAGDHHNQLIDDRGYLIRDLAFINSTKEILENRNIKYIFLAMVPIDNSDQYSVVKISNCDDILDLYKDTIKEIRPSIYEKIFNFNWYSRPYLPEDFRLSEDFNKIEKEYNTVAGVDWPEFDKVLRGDFLGVAKDIIKEITTKPWGWQFNIHKKNRKDAHPIPSEHLEYLDLIVPEYKISNKTRQWIKEIETQHKHGNDISHLWTKSNPIRF